MPKPPTEKSSLSAVSTGPGVFGDSIEEKIWARLRTCYDPEIPLNIVDLGLVYEVKVNGPRADIKMTLTSPGCHLGGQIAGNVRDQALALDEIEEANVELVWDPPWHQGMISELGRKRLGLDSE
jgi:metal-sulfur cluster biosynthetic enzyme